MTLTTKQVEELNTAARPLVAFMTENCHPHCTVIVEHGSVELVEGVVRIPMAVPSVTNPH
jgi:hypothetical protein